MTSKIHFCLLLYLQAREGNAPIVDPMAVQFCARKVAAVAGDIRKALDVCRRAVEIVENDVCRQTVLKTTGMEILPTNDGLIK